MPRRQSDFNIHSGADSKPFFSTEDLRVAGLVTESLSYGTKGRLFEAESRLRRALALSPDNNSIKFNLSVVLSQQGNGEEAMLILDDLRRQEGDKPRIMMAIADAHTSQGEYAQAREDLKVAFAAFQQAQNAYQASMVARSISNLAFAIGNEQEALCYSYEAFSLAPSPQQLGFHMGILIGLNLLEQGEEFMKAQLQISPALGASASAHFYRALARGGKQDPTGALEEVETALDLITESPELGAEAQAVWWILKKNQRNVEGGTLQVSAKESDALQTAYEELSRLREKPTYSMLRWPVYFQNQIETAENIS